MRQRLLSLAVSLLILAGQVQAEEAVPSRPQSDIPDLGAQITKCFLPTSQAKGRVVVAFDADAEGKVTNARVVLGGETDGEKALAAAGIRAILRCSPFKLRAAGEVRVPFEMPGDADPEAARAEATYDPALQRSGTYDGITFRYETLPGLCAINPQGSAFDRLIFTRFTPARARNANLVALDMDCETLAEGRARGGVRPKRLLMVTAARRDADLPAHLGDFLAALHTRFTKREPLTRRFWQDPPIAGSPVVGLDEYAVYQAGRSLNDDGSIAVAGMTAFTLSHDRQMILARMEFGGRNLSDDMPASMMRVVKSLHDLSK